jgi:DNA-directed RNA polymerase specialized sigma24 family protein
LYSKYVERLRHPRYLSSRFQLISSEPQLVSPDQREAVVLKIYQGFKFEEMAEILSCPVSTVKSRLYTALELLKAELAPVRTRGVS